MTAPNTVDFYSQMATEEESERGKYFTMDKLANGIFLVVGSIWAFIFWVSVKSVF